MQLWLVIKRSCLNRSSLNVALWLVATISWMFLIIAYQSYLLEGWQLLPPKNKLCSLNWKNSLTPWARCLRVRPWMKYSLKGRFFSAFFLLYIYMFVDYYLTFIIINIHLNANGCIYGLDIVTRIAFRLHCNSKISFEMLSESSLDAVASLANC